VKDLAAAGGDLDEYLREDTPTDIIIPNYSE
jgi:hypothetical protein